MREAKDKVVSACASQFLRREVMKCLDVRRNIEAKFPVRLGMSSSDFQERDAQIELRIKEVISAISEVADQRDINEPPILVDEDKRPFYKKFQDSDSPLNKILIKTDRGIVDLSMLSSIVSSAESFEMNRVYLKRDDTEGLAVVNGFLN